MVTKYNIGDKVLIEGEVEVIRVDKNGKNVSTVYRIRINDGYSSETISQHEKECVSIEALEDLYNRMGKEMVVIDEKSNILDSCKALLVEVVKAYEAKEDE